jgi:peptidyl-prolyl cis-trans isomerase SurA
MRAGELARRGWAVLALASVGLLGCLGPSSQPLRQVRPDLSQAERDRLHTPLLDASVSAPPRKPVAPGAPAEPTPPPPPSPVVARSQAPEGGSSLGPPPPDGQLAVRIIARVDDLPILEQELREAAFPRMAELLRLPEPERSQRQKQVRQQELMRLVERELIVRELVKLKKTRPALIAQLEREAAKEYERRLKEIKQANGIASDEQLKALLESQRLTLSGLRRQVERNYMAMQFIGGNIGPTVQAGTGLAAVREYYETHPEEFQDEDQVKWLDLFLDAAKYGGKPQAEQFARQLAGQAKSDDDFVRLVKEHDGGDARFREGVGLGEKRGEIRPAAVEEALFKLKPGEMALVELDSGFHLVRVVGRTHAGRRPFDEKTQAEVRKRLQNLIAEREYRKLMDDLKRKAAIVITEEQ